MTEYVISVKDVKLSSSDACSIQDEIKKVCRYSKRDFDFFISPFAYIEEGPYITSFKVRVEDAQWLAREAYKIIVGYGIPKESIICEVADWHTINFDILSY